MWKPMYRSAATAPSGRFTVSLSELEYDAPFTAIISYDPRLPQPWSRVDVDREIVDLTYAPFGQGELVPVALSNEGDIYMLMDVVQRSKIPGAGVGSADADGRGQTWKICCVDSIMFVGGENGQFYQISAKGLMEVPLPEANLTVLALADDGNGGVVLACELARTQPAINYEDMITAESIMAMMQKQITALETSAPQSRFFVFRDGAFSPISAPVTQHVRTIQKGDSDELVAVGVGDLVLKGTASGLHRITLPQKGRTYLSGVPWQGAIWLASDTEVVRWAGDALKPVDLKLSPFTANGKARPMSLSASDEKLCYFDYLHDMRFFDGKDWTIVVIPPALKQREFDPSAPL